ncbi:apurinic-apyrimidinic endonuclease-like [Liolophura sinensis]|uniref:apurinic-apyrimidinic endonuclease-like n=1 Tax=Liolophura sinensis TaxID=3198878 RepID=UPI0031587C85
MPPVKSTKERGDYFEKAGKRKSDLNQKDQVSQSAVAKKKRRKDTDLAYDDQETVFSGRKKFSSNEILEFNIEKEPPSHREVEVIKSKTEVSPDIHENQISSLNSSCRRVTRSRARQLKRTNSGAVNVRGTSTEGTSETVVRKAKPARKDISQHTVKTSKGKGSRTKKVPKDKSKRTSNKIKERERNPSDQENTKPVCATVKKEGGNSSDQTSLRQAVEGKGSGTKNIETARANRKLSSKNSKKRERNPSDQENTKSVCATVKKEGGNSSDQTSLRQAVEGKGSGTKNIETARANRKLSSKNGKKRERNPSDQENTKPVGAKVKKEGRNSCDQTSLRQAVAGKGSGKESIEKVTRNTCSKLFNNKIKERERNLSDQEKTKPVCATVKREGVVGSDQTSFSSKQTEREKKSQRRKGVKNFAFKEDRNSTVMKKFVGAHLSISGGLENVIKEAREVGAEAVGLFLKSQRTWKSKPLEEKAVENFKKACQDLKFPTNMILPHGSYLLNCGSHKADLLAKSRESLIDDVHRCDRLGIQLFNFHPGSTCGEITVDECVSRIAESINIAHNQTQQVTVLIENMSCQGHTIGGKFEELRDIIAQVKDKDRVGVCLDTCHAFAAGFNIKTKAGYEQMMTEFENIIGLEYLKAVHLNDSKGDVGCHKDRHENIGKGKIGLEGFRRVMKDKRLNNIPMILETPLTIDDSEEIQLLYSL